MVSTLAKNLENYTSVPLCSKTKKGVKLSTNSSMKTSMRQTRLICVFVLIFTFDSILFQNKCDGQFHWAKNPRLERVIERLSELRELLDKYLEHSQRPTRALPMMVCF